MILRVRIARKKILEEHALNLHPQLWIQSAVRPATLALRSFLGEQGIPGEELVACELALAEACNNAIAYATETGRSRRVAVEAQCSPSAIELRVTDHTPGFDWPQEITLPDAS
jgi:anti-sigma regulatory factor (Ser/Thr protein kinase)